VRLRVAFGVAVLIMLAVVIAGDQVVGLSPATPVMTDADRMRHLRLVAAAVGLVISVDAFFVWLALRHPPGPEPEPDDAVE
jgi:hypothetical protein